MRFSVVSATMAAAALMIATGAGAARAQTALPLTGFGSLPSFAWDGPTLSPKWEGSYARISSGFQVTSGKHMATSAGPTFGLEMGTMRREGNFVYGIVGAVDYAPSIGGYGVPSFGSIAYTRDFAGAFQIKTGVLVTPDVLLYTKVGMSVLHSLHAQRHRPSAGGARGRGVGRHRQADARPRSRRCRPADSLRPRFKRLRA